MWNIPHSKIIIQRYFIMNVHRFPCEFRLVIANCNETFTSGKIFKIKIPNFMNILPAVDKFLRADGHTDMTVLTDTFCNFTNGPKMRGGECTSTHNHKATYWHGQHWLHSSLLIRKIVFHILVLRYFKNLHPYITQILHKSLFIDQRGINIIV